MKKSGKLKLGRTVPVLIPIGVIVLACFVHSLPLLIPKFNAFQKLEWITYDERVKLAAKFPQPYATNLLGAVLITDKDLAEMNQEVFGEREKFPWPTRYYGHVVRELRRQGATVIGFDILFELQDANHAFKMPDSSLKGSDEFFSEQLREAGNVILAAEGEGKDGEGQIFPDDIFRNHALDIGNIFTPIDGDGVLRRAKPYSVYPVWHPVIRQVANAFGVDTKRPRIEPHRIVFPPLRAGVNEHAIPLNKDGTIKIEELMPGEDNSTPPRPFATHRAWNLGIVLAARALGLDLSTAEIRPGQIILRGPGGIERRIPVDAEGYFHINWCLTYDDVRFHRSPIVPLIGADIARHWYPTAERDDSTAFTNRLVIIGSTGTGKNISDRGATPLQEDTPLLTKHLNVANSIITGRFIQPFTPVTELLLIVLMGVISALLTWRLRPLVALASVLAVLVVYAAVAVILFVRELYWLPLVLPLGGGLVMTHGFMVTYRVLVEQKEQRRIKSIFSKIVSPNVVNELLKAEEISVSGARRRVTVYFADIRGFTRVTDESHAGAEEYVRSHKLPPSVAEAYLDAQASVVLTTVNLYLGVIADSIKKHNGTLDKYIGDCVMAFWGAPIPNDRHALDCVLAAIDAQRAVYRLNLSRAAENKRREEENKARREAGKPPLPMLTLLAMGSGVNTGMVTVGLMGSDQHMVNYTVFGREVNLASRLEGISGRGRIIISDSTYKELQRLDPELAGTCTELPPQEVKGFREQVRIHEVQWREINTELQGLDTGILTGRRVIAPTDLVPRPEAPRQTP